MFSPADFLSTDFTKTSLQVTDKKHNFAEATELTASFAEILQAPLTGAALPPAGKGLPQAAGNEALHGMPAGAPATILSIIDTGLPAPDSLPGAAGLPAATTEETAPPLSTLIPATAAARAGETRATPRAPQGPLLPSVATADARLRQAGEQPLAARPGGERPRPAVNGNLPVIASGVQDPQSMDLDGDWQAALQGERLSPQTGGERPAAGAAQTVVGVAGNAAGVAHNAAGVAEGAAAGVAARNTPYARTLVADSAEFTDKLDAAAKISTPSAPGGQPLSDTLQPASTSATSARPAPLVMTTIPVPVGEDGWGEALQDRVMWMTTRSIQSAEIRLSPAELGPIRVHISVEDDAATLSFTAQHPLTREALEQAMPRLREMLGDHGLSLADSSVSDSADENVQKDRQAREQAAARDGRVVDEGDTAPQVHIPRSPAGLVDTFA